jgi:PAS domain S-box-containing protein
MNPRRIDRQLRTVIDQVPDGVLIESRERVAYINPAYAQFLGYPSTSELEGVTIRDIADPEDFERLCWFGRCRSEGKPAPTRYTFRARGRTGGIVTFDASISMTRVEGEFLITTIVRELQTAPVHAGFVLPGTKRLSPRELEIVHYLLEGKRSKEIALILGVSEKTIGTHRARAFQKLALRGVGDLFRVAAEQGLLNG